MTEIHDDATIEGRIYTVSVFYHSLLQVDFLLLRLPIQNLLLLL
jgi:hypothetical protein